MCIRDSTWSVLHSSKAHSLRSSFASQCSKLSLIHISIVDGEADDLPEWAFFNVGTLEDARQKAAEKLAEEKGGEMCIRDSPLNNYY